MGLGAGPIQRYQTPAPIFEAQHYSRKAPLSQCLLPNQAANDWIVRTVLDLFGADQSNFPIDRLHADLDTIHAGFGVILVSLPDGAQAAFPSCTPQRVYGPPDPARPRNAG